MTPSHMQETHKSTAHTDLSKHFHCLVILYLAQTVAANIVLPPLPPTLEPPEYNTNYILYWNSVALDLNRLTVPLRGPNRDPPTASRALGILHLAINDAYFAIRPDLKNISTTYLTPNEANPALRLPDLNGAYDPRQAVAGAATTVLQQLYTTKDPAIATATTDGLSEFIQQAVTAFPGLVMESSSYKFGVAVGKTLLALLDDPATDLQGDFQPKPGRYQFNDDPTNPVRIVPVDVNNPNGPTKAIKVYVAPYYGATAKRLSVQGTVNGVATEHIIADPPVGFSVNNTNEYDFAFDEIIREGGAIPSNPTRRTPYQTATGYFWAYDGTNLIGTPPRHYDQILRAIAWARKPPGAPTDEAVNADFARLFALVNAAQADAGIFAWQEKYHFSFWRPLSGVRQDGIYGNPLADPFFLELGAPPTNTNNIPFKPAFPSYPSGHATLGGAVFQAIRLYYKRRDNLSFAVDAPDNISFTVGSDELNGINRDLRQPYDPTLPITDQEGVVRTYVSRHFNSLWEAMLDNGISRVYLGVHWLFDIFSPQDTLASTTVNPDGTSNDKNAADVRYTTLGPRGDRPCQLFPVGGVPLGMGVANDVFEGNLKPTPANLQPPFDTKLINSRVRAKRSGNLSENNCWHRQRPHPPYLGGRAVRG